MALCDQVTFWLIKKKLFNELESLYKYSLFTKLQLFIKIIISQPDTNKGENDGNKGHHFESSQQTEGMSYPEGIIGCQSQY